jgi:glycosyltransferase involved in cell wall biosynthesis
VVVEVAVVMPAYNEAAGIAGFLMEISDALRFVDHGIVVQDDCSTDDTLAIVRDLAVSGMAVEVLEGTRNAGHGASTLAVLGHALDAGADYVVAVDGDGQFRGADLARLAALCRDHDLDVVEGVRSGRRGPSYRAVVTSATRLLVWARCRQLPRDANTPLRVYRASALARLLEDVPASSPTPNLHISALTRSEGLRYAEVSVEWLVRRGGIQGSSGFGARMPSPTFVRFAVKALAQWLRGTSSRLPQQSLEGSDQA